MINRREALTAAGSALVAFPATATAAAQPHIDMDAHLIWLNKEWSRIEAQANVSQKDEEIGALSTKLLELEDAIFSTPAHSVLGISVKLGLVRYFADEDGSFDSSHRGFAAIEQDIARIAEQ
jgi:hypothetical protein